MIRENTLTIYADGSSYSQPRRGGIGIRYIYINKNFKEQRIDLDFLGYKNATNNQMELFACIVALKESLNLKIDITYNIIIIFTDSRYIVDNYQKAMFRWPKQNWFKSDESPVLNADLWKQLNKWIKKVRCRVEFQWVKAHSKDADNRAVDNLAKKSARTPINDPLSIVNVRRKKTIKTVDLGSVKMCGQRISIRIVTSEYLRTQKINRYKYEVISKNSKYYENVDVAFSYENMKVGHSYVVTLNKEQHNPRILKVVKEIL